MKYLYNVLVGGVSIGVTTRLKEAQKWSKDTTSGLPVVILANSI